MKLNSEKTRRLSIKHEENQTWCLRNKIGNGVRRDKRDEKERGEGEANERQEGKEGTRGRSSWRAAGVSEGWTAVGKRVLGGGRVAVGKEEGRMK